MSGLASQLAVRLLGHAARVMPPARRPWIQAMRAELDYIPGPLAAAVFALGCVRASYAQRIVTMYLVAVVTRWTIAGLTLAWAGFLALAVVLLGMLKSDPAVVPADLGSDPGTAATLAFIRAYPAWEIGLVALTAFLLAAGVVQLIRRRPVALPILALAVAAASVSTLIDLRLPGFQSLRFDAPSDLAASLLIPLFLLAPVWWLSRRSPDLT